MLDANDPAFREQYPTGATVYDRTGRRISGVMAFDPETGEVIRIGESRIVGTILRMARGRQQQWDPPAEFRRHGFWPAPLTVEARQWLHIGFCRRGRDRPPLPVLDDRTPEEICGYGDDGLCSH